MWRNKPPTHKALIEDLMKEILGFFEGNPSFLSSTTDSYWQFVSTQQDVYQIQDGMDGAEITALLKFKLMDFPGFLLVSSFIASLALGGMSKLIKTFRCL